VRRRVFRAARGRNGSSLADALRLCAKGRTRLHKRKQILGNTGFCGLEYKIFEFHRRYIMPVLVQGRVSL